jgi:hypothetical protein
VAASKSFAVTIPLFLFGDVLSFAGSEVEGVIKCESTKDKMGTRDPFGTFPSQ